MPKMIFVKRGKKYSRSMFLKNFCLNTSKLVKKKKFFFAKYHKKERVKIFAFGRLKKKKKKDSKSVEKRSAVCFGF